AAVAAGYQHTCAVTSAGNVKCWGYNGRGELGNGTTNSTTGNATPTLVQDAAGTALSGIKDVAVSASHSCALTNTGGAACWGDDLSGQLGRGSSTSLPQPRAADVVGLSGNIAALAIGNTHSCALISGSGVKCWGSNIYGQVGDAASTGNHLAPFDVPG